MSESVQLLLMKDFQTVVISFGTPTIRSKIYEFPKFLVNFVQDVCLFPGALYPFLGNFTVISEIFSKIRISPDESYDDDMFVPQPYINERASAERLPLISQVFQRYNEHEFCDHDHHDHEHSHSHGHNSHHDDHDHHDHDHDHSHGHPYDHHDHDQSHSPITEII